MPLVANTSLPTFNRLRSEGETVLPDEIALHQDIRELHIGLLNMMPDTALEATERQFFRLVGESNQIAQFYIHPFTIDELPRGVGGREHVQKHYSSFEQIKQEGLDALIITGANVSGSELSDQPFWESLIEIVDWAYDNVTSILCSCLATHAVLEFRYRQKRRPLGYKRWGVYSHRIQDHIHPLIVGVNTRFDVPHSRFNDVSAAQFEQAGLRILVQSEEAGVHLAVSDDLFRIVFFQGHPEYDTISLLKEYKREVGRYIRGEIKQYPPFPDNYFSLRSEAILHEYRDRVEASLGNTDRAPEFPEHLLVESLENTWHDSAEAVLNNWIGKVYQLTNDDRCKPFMDGVDPDDPLGLRNS